MTQPALQRLDDGRARLNGELSFATAAGLWTASESFLDSTADALTLDLAGVERIDSAGLALLTAWTGRARGAGKTLRFTNASERVMTLAEVHNLVGVLAFE